MYNKERILQIAKRYNNPNRSYLLVNPLQAKHVPASPDHALSMMIALGEKVNLEYPCAKLVIGFSETATAIGAVVAAQLSGCTYIQTTRESFSATENWINFVEEHSHATEQKICKEPLASALEKTDTVVFVDDELTTGKTLMNIVTQMRSAIPSFANKKIVAASIINRISNENTKKLVNFGIQTVQLLKLTDEDYSSKVADLEVVAPAEVPHPTGDLSHITVNVNSSIPDPRVGTSIEEYIQSAHTLANEALDIFCREIPQNASVLVLGTEECMYPALELGHVLSKHRQDCAVFCHATTRSPIGILDQDGYPARTGYRIHSIYDLQRVTYIYNIATYDTVILLTDAPNPIATAVDDLIRIFAHHGCRRLIEIRGN